VRRILASSAAELGLKQRFTRPRRPQANGKGRALQPDPPRGVGLRPALSIKRRPAPLAVSLASPVQPMPHSVEGRTADLPCQQPGGEPKL